MDTVVYIIYIFGAILSGVLINAILFEVAHILGAKAGRYSIISVNILGLLWYRDDNKTKFRFKGYDGLTGETVILPKEDVKKEPNPTPYIPMTHRFRALLAQVVLISQVGLQHP